MKCFDGYFLEFEIRFRKKLRKNKPGSFTFLLIKQVEKSRKQIFVGDSFGSDHKGRHNFGKFGLTGKVQAMFPCFVWQMISEEEQQPSCCHPY